MAFDLQAALTQHFGYGAFRKGQEAIMRSVLSSRPTIAILPTGGGKSLCYQLPALLLEGTTVVVSPLVALMKDQVDALVARGIKATFINSSLSESERQERQAALRRGEWRLVYVAPERFKSSSFLSAISGLRIPLLAVDEAHCISAWGHDFRPEYQRLAQARTQISAERVLALTATATPEVRKDIAAALQMKDPKIFVAGFDRPNLFIEVLKVAGDKDKLGRLLALARQGGPGLVYAATRKNVEKVVSALRANGLEALGYHAGMEDDERSSVQDRFVRGNAPIVVATNAFGMGVDKPDIRFVAHFDVPRSLEAYYQEIGRAGRDGEDSLALLLFNFADVMMQRRMIDSGRASRELVSTVWESARSLRQGTVEALARSAAVHGSEAQAAVRLLESAGHLERGRARDFAVLTPSIPAAELTVDFELLELRVQRERAMLDRLVRFADTKGCRRQNLLRYFGDEEAPRGCSACESCVGGRAPEAAAISGAARLRTRSPAGPAEPASLEGVHPGVFEKLRALRTELAREGRVPPYVVFHDATLRELSRALPDSEASFLAVKGAGPSRWQRYGERVLAAIAAGQAGGAAPASPGAAPVAAAAPVVRKRAASPAPEEPPILREPVARWAAPAAAAQQTSPSWLDEVPPPLEDTASGQRASPRAFVAQAPSAGARGDPGLAAPGRDEVWTLCAEGLALPEIARRLGRPAADIASQLAEAMIAGRAVDVVRLIGSDRVAAIRAAARGAEGDLVALRRRLPFAAPLAEIRLALIP
jgi:ATP-dependent DNA helicase RecQ